MIVDTSDMVDWRVTMKWLAVLMISFLMLSAPVLAVERKTDFQKTQERADRNYEKQNYKKALSSYRALARTGDIFSQYRIATMYMQGQGTKVNLHEAYGWAVLSTQSNNPDLVKFKQELFESIPDGEKEKAHDRARELWEKYSNRAIAAETRRNIQRELRSCTGSRIGSTCESIYMAQMPGYAQIAPGEGGSEGAQSAAAASAGNAGEAGNMGGGAPSREVEHYMELRESLRQLDQYLEHHGGTVELGEFEVLEEAPKTETDKTGDN
jgi:hypothetical protein